MNILSSNNDQFNDPIATPDLGSRSTIVREKRRTSYTIIDNHVVNDLRLTLDALGLLVFILSKPDNWTVRINHLRRTRAVGRDKTRRLLRELEQAGYLIRKRVKLPNGRFDWLSFVRENSTIDGFSVGGSPVGGSPVGGSPVDITNTDLTIPEKTKKGNNNASAAPKNGRGNSAEELLLFSSSLSREEQSFFDRIKDLALEGEFTKKQAEYWLACMDEYDSDKVLSYLIWCFKQGWSWDKAVNVNRKGKKLAVWQVEADKPKKKQLTLEEHIASLDL